MTVYAWTGDGTKIRAARCDQHTCAGWDLSILGGSRQPSGATWPASETLRATPDGSRLLTIAASGDVKVNLLDGKPPKTLVHGADFWRGAAWSADGSRVYFVRSPGVIESVSASGGSPSPVFSADKGTEVADIGPALPDGRMFAVLVKTPSAGQRSAATALVEIHTAARDATRTRALTEWGSDEIEEISASSDGSRFTFLRTTVQADVYVADFDARHTVLTTPKRLTLDERDDFGYCVDARQHTGDLRIKSERDSRSLQAASGQRRRRTVRRRSGQAMAASCDQRRSVGPVHRRTARETHSDHARTARRRSPRTVGDVPTRCWRCCATARFTVVVCLSNTVTTPGSPFVVFALDPIRGKQQELTQFPSSARGANLTPDGEHFAYIVPEESGIQNRIRIVSFHGEPSHDIVVKNAVRLSTLDSFPTGGFLSQEIASSHQTLLFITAEGNANVLWRPEQLDVGPAIPSPDGKHLAINASTRQSNVWLADQR